MSIDSTFLEQSFRVFHASISPENLIGKYSLKNLAPKEGYLTNAFGVLVKPDYVPQMLSGRAGEVEGPPIPANWHADMAEFGAALRAVDLAKGSFTMMELGCGWGCWMNIAGVVAKRHGLKVHLIGVEGDEGHVGFAHEALRDNQFTPDEYTVYHGVAASSKGVALFPKQTAGSSWGLEPVFDLEKSAADKMLATGSYFMAKQYTLMELAQNHARIDLLHVDIQGGEESLIPAAMPFLSEKVAYLLIGTHSREIEGVMFKHLLAAGFVLEIERPAVLSLDSGKPSLVVDGVHGWRNTRLLPEVDIADPNGAVELLAESPSVKAGEEFKLNVRIVNSSETDWQSVGPKPVMISYKWVSETENGGGVVEGVRTPLPDTIIRAGDAKEAAVRIIAPPVAGNYELEITCIQECVRWFAAPAFASNRIRLSIGGI